MPQELPDSSSLEVEAVWTVCVLVSDFLFLFQTCINFAGATLYLLACRSLFGIFLLYFILLTLALVLAAGKEDPRVYSTPLDGLRLLSELAVFLYTSIGLGVELFKLS